MVRYTSRNQAIREIENLKKQADIEIMAGKATVLSKCLEYLTDFIYDKVKKKRLQAIDDMVKLCQTAIHMQDFQAQNQYIRDEIYYYFNARYSRRGNMEGRENASMPDDITNDLSVAEMVLKYIRLVEDPATGELISNIKHLRGSTMKMLRSHPDSPQFRILKSYALFILADTIKDLLEEAKNELVLGLLEWRRQEDGLNIPEFIGTFLEKIAPHASNYDPQTAFDDIEDQYYSLYYGGWLKKFTGQFTEQ